MNQIHMHAEQLSDRVIQAIRTSPRIKSLGSVSEEELRRRFFDLFRDLGRWLGEKGEEEIEATYGEIGRRRCREGTPLNELVHAVILVKQELWGYIEKHIAPTSERNLYQEEQIIEMKRCHFCAKQDGRHQSESDQSRKQMRSALPGLETYHVTAKLFP